MEESATRTVYVPEGAAVEGSWRNTSGRSIRYVLRFIVPEGGSLNVSIAGETHTFGEGQQEYQFVSAAETLVLAFVSEAGTAEILRCGRYLGTTVVIR